MFLYCNIRTILIPCFRTLVTVLCWCLACICTDIILGIYICCSSISVYSGTRHYTTTDHKNQSYVKKSIIRRRNQNPPSLSRASSDEGLPKITFLCISSTSRVPGPTYKKIAPLRPQSVKHIVVWSVDLAMLLKILLFHSFQKTQKIDAATKSHPTWWFEEFLFFSRLSRTWEQVEETEAGEVTYQTYSNPKSPCKMDKKEKDDLLSQHSVGINHDNLVSNNSFSWDYPM